MAPKVRGHNSEAKQERYIADRGKLASTGDSTESFPWQLSQGVSRDIFVIGPAQH